ncbi:MAG TPA: hypothetical protein VEH31_25130, partial [Streptosporangiaceae bacterium]|nr:hypothetical protein [Streptosporangiaceae bacterium]
AGMVSRHFYAPGAIPRDAVTWCRANGRFPYTATRVVGGAGPRRSPLPAGVPQDRVFLVQDPTGSRSRSGSYRPVTFSTHAEYQG